MTKTFSLGLLAAASLLAASTASAAQAASLTSWLSIGDVSQASALANPQAGSTAPSVNLGSQAYLLGTASLGFEDDAPLPAGALNQSGNNVVDSNALTSALSLPGAALDNDAAGLYAMEGSALFNTFTVHAGDTLSFDWRLLAQASAGGEPVPDTAWLVLGSSVIKLMDGSSLSTVNAGWLDSSVQHSQYTFSTGGTVKIGFAIADVNSFDTTSMLAIQNVALTNAAVPEPESLALLLAGLGVLAAVRKKRKHPEK